jgi:hypothetical protein
VNLIKELINRCMSQISKSVLFEFVWKSCFEVLLLNFFGNLVFLKVTYDVFLMLQLRTEPLVPQGFRV